MTQHNTPSSDYKRTELQIKGTSENIGLKEIQVYLLFDRLRKPKTNDPPPNRYLAKLDASAGKSLCLWACAVAACYRYLMDKLMIIKGPNSRSWGKPSPFTTSFVMFFIVPCICAWKFTYTLGFVLRAWRPPCCSPFFCFLLLYMMFLRANRSFAVLL